MEKLQFIEDRSTGIEVVCLDHVAISYPPHTHTGHYVFGIITEGKIAIRIADQCLECSEIMKYTQMKKDYIYSPSLCLHYADIYRTICFLEKSGRSPLRL